jgi:hypothetical protein
MFTRITNYLLKKTLAAGPIKLEAMGYKFDKNSLAIQDHLVLDVACKNQHCSQAYLFPSSQTKHRLWTGGALADS